jgi:hypothetical protein
MAPPLSREQYGANSPRIASRTSQHRACDVAGLEPVKPRFESGDLAPQPLDLAGGLARRGGEALKARPSDTDLG